MSRGERWVTAALVVSIGASLGLFAIYLFTSGQPQLEGILLGLALGGVGLGMVIWSIALLHAQIESEPWRPLASPADVRRGAGAALDLESITRRRFLIRLLAGAGVVLAAALALPTFSLGPAPGRDLFRTAWRRGARLVDADGNPIRPGDLSVESVRTVFPEGAIGSPDAQTLLIRVRPQDLRLPAERLDWTPGGAVAYSKICTHAGCPVGLYRVEDHSLLCPCHQSTFDVLRGAVPTFGPAARALPQLPLDLDAEGYLVARDDFSEPVGPSFWNLTHHDQGAS
jgi:ubiquinol-cytochrome c reductase iron-sulfur subunit